MSTSVGGIEILSAEECREKLGSTSVGRLAVDIAGKPDIFPINFVMDGPSIVFRSGAGTKLAAAALLHEVAFEIDGYEPLERVAWSVVVKGWANEISKMQEVYEAEELPLFPWAANPKPNFIKITPQETTGRRFHLLDDVVPDASIGWTPILADRQAAAPAPDAEYHDGAPYMHPD